MLGVAHCPRLDPGMYQSAAAVPVGRHGIRCFPTTLEAPRIRGGTHPTLGICARFRGSLRSLLNRRDIGPGDVP